MPATQQPLIPEPSPIPQDRHQVHQDFPEPQREQPEVRDEPQAAAEVRKKRKSGTYLFVIYPVDLLPTSTFHSRCQLMIANTKEQVSQRSGRAKHLINRIEDNEVAAVLLACRGQPIEDIAS